MMQILHGNFTSAFSLVFCYKFSYEKPSLDPERVPNLNFENFSVPGLGNVHGYGSMSHFMTLVGWQVCRWYSGVVTGVAMGGGAECHP